MTVFPHGVRIRGEMNTTPSWSHFEGRFARYEAGDAAPRPLDLNSQSANKR